MACASDRASWARRGERGVGVGSSEARENRRGNAGTGGTCDRGDVGDMGMREADGVCCSIKSASCDNDFFPPLGLLPKPNRAPSERIEERPDPLFPLLPCESPERAVDTVLGEGDFFLPTEPAAGESRG